MCRLDCVQAIAIHDVCLCSPPGAIGLPGNSMHNTCILKYSRDMRKPGCGILMNYIEQAVDKVSLRYCLLQAGWFSVYAQLFGSAT